MSEIYQNIMTPGAWEFLRCFLSIALSFLLMCAVGITIVLLAEAFMAIQAIAEASVDVIVQRIKGNGK